MNPGHAYLTTRGATNTRFNVALAPVASAERVVPLDIIRGAALIGVLLVNLITDFRTPLSANILGSHEPYGWGGALVFPIFRSLIEFKAFTLFSFLFGVGVAIQAGRGSTQQRIRFLARRFSALLAIGLIHILLIWNGDILTLYAICGLVLIPLLRLRDYALFVLGLALIILPTIAAFPVVFPPAATLKSLTAGALQAYGKGTWHQLFAFRLLETRLLIVPLLMLSFPRTLGLMLCGVGAWRKGWMENNPRLWRRAAILGTTIGIGGHWLGIGEAENLGVALVYAAVLLLWHPRALWIAAAGRMALTNYLMESVIFGFVFYSYGLGWFERIGVVATLLGGVVVYVLQLVFSEWWLKRFRFGPIEWLWRCVSYLQWQPFARGDGLTVSRAAAQVLLVAAFGAAIPLVHLGIPTLLARVGPRWGWRGGRPTVGNLCGTVAILLGAYLLAWTAKTLLHESQKLPSRVRLGLRPTHLVQTGPYAWLRHPMYAAECCLWIGTIVLFGSPLAAVSFLCLFALAARWIVLREERALEEQFGEEYRSYRARVRSLGLPPLFNR